MSRDVSVVVTVPDLVTNETVTNLVSAGLPAGWRVTLLGQSVRTSGGGTDYSGPYGTGGQPR